ncbi:MAG: AI-2E family transporter [Corynebacterium sp.]|nr:AI-2E family transporter [Corynebacterium sp.]
MDPALIAALSPIPLGDQVDRSVAAASMLKSAALWSLRLLIIGFFLYFVGGIVGSFWQGILPVLLSLIVCTVLAPISSRLRGLGLPSALAAIITILGFGAIVGWTFSLIAPDFANQSQTLYLQTVEGIQRLQLWAQGPPLNLDPEDIGIYIDEAAKWIQEQGGDIAGSLLSGVGTATSLIITLVIMLVMTFFFLKDGYNFLPWLRQATGRRTGWHLTEVLTRGWSTLGGYIRAQAIVSLIDAVFIGAGLYFIGVPLAFALAVITFMAGFIPLVGAITAGAISVLIALVSLGFTEALLVLGLVILVQQLEGNVLSPWLQSRAMNLHPVVVLVSVTVGGALFDLVGAFLAVPAAAMLAVCYRYVQDMAQLQSGEKRVEDIEFSTIAGYLAARYTEAQGAERRQAWAGQKHSTALHDAEKDSHSSSSNCEDEDYDEPEHFTSDEYGDAVEAMIRLDTTSESRPPRFTRARLSKARDVFNSELFERIIDPRGKRH